MVPNPLKLKKIYSYIARHEDAPLRQDMAQAINSYALENFLKKDPEFYRLYFQSEKELPPFVTAGGVAKSEKDAIDAFSQWLNSEGINWKEDERDKISILLGKIQDPDTKIAVNWISLTYFDLEE